MTGPVTHFLALIFIIFRKILPHRLTPKNDIEANAQPTESPSTSNCPFEAPANENEDDVEFDPLEPFRQVIDMINFQELQSHALELQSALSGRYDAQPCTANQLSCTIDENAICRSFNPAYTIEFSDGCRWIARFPISSPSFGSLDKEKMDSEYHTMRYLRNSLQLAEPEVYAWNTDTAVVGAPLALMSFVSGVSIMDRWFDRGWCTEDKRLKVLTNLAHYVAALQFPTSDRTGTLRFASDGSFSHLGPEIQVILDDECNEVDNAGLRRLTIKESPCNHSLDEWMLDGWDNLEGVEEESLAREKGCLEVVRLALASIPDYLRRTDRFVLEMMKYNYQNIFIDDDCNITGFIDWDGVRAAPQGMGATRFPSWITRDWAPCAYVNPQSEEESWTIQENTPEELSKYRKHYADIFASLNLGRGYDPRETRLSHILGATRKAARVRKNRRETVIKLLFHAFRGQIPFCTRECFEALGNLETEAGKGMEEKVVNALETMWFAEWECEETKADNKLSFRDMTPLSP